MDDPVELVRRGYDSVSHRYRGDDDATQPTYGAWVESLTRSLQPGAHVLDVGCGNGIPVARDLTRRGFRVTRLDLSEVQVERARALVPDATFVRGDMAHADFADASFDAVVALYSLIHVPVSEHSGVLARFRRWTAPHGVLVLITGATAWTGTEASWLGGDAPMWWSQADAATYRTWLAAAGWRVVEDVFVPEGDSGHQLFRAHPG